MHNVHGVSDETHEISYYDVVRKSIWKPLVRIYNKFISDISLNLNFLKNNKKNQIFKIQPANKL